MAQGRKKDYKNSEKVKNTNHSVPTGHKELENELVSEGLKRFGRQGRKEMPTHAHEWRKPVPISC